MSVEYSNLTFILGGARSGKSTMAEKLTEQCGSQVLYVATAEILDDEMRRRVEIHQARRSASWITVEAPHFCAQQIASHLNTNNAICGVLLDCLSVLSSNTLLSMPEDTTETTTWDHFRKQEADPLLQLIAAKPDIPWFMVSNEVGMGVVPAYPLGRLYRDLLGRVNQYFAAASGTFIFMAAGVPLKMKG